MRYRLTVITALLMLACTFANVSAQTANDTIYNPPVIYGNIPKVFEIAGIKVKVRQIMRTTSYSAMPGLKWATDWRSPVKK